MNHVNTYTTEIIKYEHLCINYGNQYMFSVRIAMQENNVFIWFAQLKWWNTCTCES
jgi:hypothetical protein